jgi:hypothetical protein
MTLEWESQGLVDECTARNLEDAIQMTTINSESIVSHYGFAVRT